jgi:phosphate transport system substrate-binding protein
VPKLARWTTTTRTAAAVAAALLAAAAAAAASPAAQRGSTITGAGSTFVAPLVAQWIPAVASAYGYELQYSAIGSGGGISAVTNRTVDFGASDAPLSRDQFAACKGCLQIPWALSATAIFYNLPGVTKLLHMDGPTLAKIFMGRITKWNDPAIRRLNRHVALPSTAIAVAHRSDNSGTTYNLTDYLSSVSPAWRSRYGKGVAVNWPVGTGGQGSRGVAAIVTQTTGAIGYADVAYAKSNHLRFFAIKNRLGRYTTPGLRGIRAAALSDVKPARGTNELSIVNPPKKYTVAYPISTYTYVVVPRQSGKAAALKKLIFWAVTKGQAYGPKLLFAPLPKSVLVVDEKAIAKIHS